MNTEVLSKNARFNAIQSERIILQPFSVLSTPTWGLRLPVAFSATAIVNVNGKGLAIIQEVEDIIKCCPDGNDARLLQENSVFSSLERRCADLGTFLHYGSLNLSRRSIEVRPFICIRDSLNLNRQDILDGLPHIPESSIILSAELEESIPGCTILEQLEKTFPEAGTLLWEDWMLIRSYFESKPDLNAILGQLPSVAPEPEVFFNGNDSQPVAQNLLSLIEECQPLLECLDSGERLATFLNSTRKELLQDKLKICVCGPASSGKSTLINALLDCVTPPLQMDPQAETTCLPIAIRSAEEPYPEGTLVKEYKTEAQFREDLMSLFPESQHAELQRKSLNGAAFPVLLHEQYDKLSSSANEPKFQQGMELRSIINGWKQNIGKLGIRETVQLSPGSRIIIPEHEAPYIREAIYHANSKLTQSCIEIIDTPGVGSYNLSHTIRALQTANESDLCVYVTKPDSLFSEAESRFLDELALILRKRNLRPENMLLFLVNKAGEFYQPDNPEALKERLQRLNDEMKCRLHRFQLGGAPVAALDSRCGLLARMEARKEGSLSETQRSRGYLEPSLGHHENLSLSRLLEIEEDILYFAHQNRIRTRLKRIAAYFIQHLHSQIAVVERKQQLSSHDPNAIAAEIDRIQTDRQRALSRLEVILSRMDQFLIEQTNSTGFLQTFTNPALNRVRNTISRIHQSHYFSPNFSTIMREALEDCFFEEHRIMRQENLNPYEALKKDLLHPELGLLLEKYAPDMDLDRLLIPSHDEVLDEIARIKPDTVNWWQWIVSWLPLTPNRDEYARRNFLDEIEPLIAGWFLDFPRRDMARTRRQVEQAIVEASDLAEEACLIMMAECEVSQLHQSFNQRIRDYMKDQLGTVLKRVQFAPTIIA